MEVKQEITIELVGFSSGQKQNKTFRLDVSPPLESAVSEVKLFVDSQNTKINYTLYYNGKFITLSMARDLELQVKEGDLFKVIPIMGGG
jgi:hypothetical protein